MVVRYGLPRPGQCPDNRGCFAMPNPLFVSTLSALCPIRLPHSVTPPMEALCKAPSLLPPFHSFLAKSSSSSHLRRAPKSFCLRYILLFLFPTFASFDLFHSNKKRLHGLFLSSFSRAIPEPVDRKKSLLRYSIYIDI
jgi:hypothetical protein